MWYVITYSFPNFNSTAVEVWECISNFIPHFVGHVMAYPCILPTQYPRYLLHYRGMMDLSIADKWSSLCVKLYKSKLACILCPYPNKMCNTLWHFCSFSIFTYFMIYFLYISNVITCHCSHVDCMTFFLWGIFSWYTIRMSAAASVSPGLFLLNSQFAIL